MTDRDLEFRASDLAGEASDLLFDSADAAGAEAKLREAIALLARVPTLSDFGQTVAESAENDLADVLIELERFDEALVLLEKRKARARTPLESIHACDAFATLEEKRSRPLLAERWLREASEIAHAGGLRLRAAAIQADERLALLVHAVGRHGEANELDARNAANRVELILDFYRDDPRPPLERMSAGAFPVRSDDIRMMSHGAITSPETFRPDGRPVAGGLRCQKIFGPVVDNECACGKYRGEAHAGLVCEVCGVEVIRSHVRATRPFAWRHP